VPETKLLLDTHALLWWAVADRSLSRKVRRLIEDQGTSVFVSAATAWEIATKVRLGKLRWEHGGSLEAYCAEQRFAMLPVTFAHGERAGSWPQAPGGDSTASTSVTGSRPGVRRSGRPGQR